MCNVYTPSHHFVVIEHPQAASHAPTERAPPPPVAHTQKPKLPLKVTWDWLHWGPLSKPKVNFFSVCGHPWWKKYSTVDVVSYNRKKVKQPKYSQMGI